MNGNGTSAEQRWVVLIREGGHWRILARYPERGEAWRSSCAARADGTPTRICQEGDPRIEKLLLGGA